MATLKAVLKYCLIICRQNGHRRWRFRAIEVLRGTNDEDQSGDQCLTTLAEIWGLRDEWASRQGCYYKLSADALRSILVNELEVCKSQHYLTLESCGSEGLEVAIPLS